MSIGKKTEFAKELRNHGTDAERRLWYFLRAKRFKGIKFRRQAPIGPYIADFICFEKRVVIECDGGQHDDPDSNDAKRDEWFQNEDFAVLRFWNIDILQNTDSVLEKIERALDLGYPPSPCPSPTRGEGTLKSNR